MSRRRLRLLVATPFLAVGLSACGAGSLAADDVAEGAEDALEAEVGLRPEVSCPDELAAEVGAETRCTLSVEGDDQEYGVTVTVTSVEDDTANFDVEVDEEPLE
ncbi:DUF4333 domain-containing protein [Blastococcus haudaquaticus]|uniref:DUF4333 domain-containing protein n=1 Tax=Blastococcus haudaquaticus TaxID=1938745 RepID=A0A286GWW3_9ACTN|nr:DUF4333 domain-containing protein [Blastococcus haudaquaticus]SOE00020.1 protein of unknown function [Blastococcus haudaquaticus]